LKPTVTKHLVATRLHGKITITKDYDAALRYKIQPFKEVTNTKKSVFLTLLTTHGLSENEYSRSCIQNELTMNDLFS
jgi:hypothetical protein